MQYVTRPLFSLIKGIQATRPALWFGMLLSLCVGLALYLVTASTIEEDSRQRFSVHAHVARNTITARIKSYTDLVRGTASMVQANYPVTRRQFLAYVKGLDLNNEFPAIETINSAEYFTHDKREAFERRMRQEPLADGSPGSQFEIWPPDRRDAYNVVTMIEPYEITPSLGRDLMSSPAQRVQHDKLRDAGKLGSSGIPIKWVHAGIKHTGLAIRMPIYRYYEPTNTVQERRTAYLGSVGVAFSVDRLVMGVIDEMPVKNARMTLIESATGGRNSQGRVLFDSTRQQPPATARMWPFADRFTQTLAIDFSGRQWDATFSVEAHEMYSGFEEFMPWLAMLAGFVSTALLYALFHALTSSRERAIKLAKGMTRELRESQSKLQLSHQNLRRLAAHADQIKEGERKRIAREIHDDLGQNLLALRIDADMLATRTRTNHSRLHDRAQATLFHIDATIKSVRQIINDLRPNVLDLGLSAAVEWQVAEFRRRTGIPCELIDEIHDATLDEQSATALFRILQESLSNIVRHAHATNVRVLLSCHKNSFFMTVSDNGVGLGAGGSVNSGSFGLVGIEERISILGGTCSIFSSKGEGTTVSVSIPVTPAPQQTHPLQPEVETA